MLDSISDKYSFRIVREIAKGGMGTVYEAFQQGTNGFEKRVAIKTLLPRLSTNPKFVELFIDEAKLVADLVHENIVQIYQLGNGELDAGEEGYFIVMEYVHGLPLAEFIHFHGVTDMDLPVELAVFITSRIARGLAYAHSRLTADGDPMHIVHRDVCPNNILITTEGLPKLGDFGVAKAANNLFSPTDRSLIGKMLYMSPEQASRELADHRTDIYALGMVLFELLAMRQAREPWQIDPLPAAKRGAVDWDALPAGVPADLRTILEKMLAFAPADRYEDTSQLAYELEYFIYHKGYGPTVVTLEKYLCEHFPYLDARGKQKAKKALGDISKTVAMDPTTYME